MDYRAKVVLLGFAAAAIIGGFTWYVVRMNAYQEAVMYNFAAQGRLIDESRAAIEKLEQSTGRFDSRLSTGLSVLEERTQKHDAAIRAFRDALARAGTLSQRDPIELTVDQR